MIEVWRGECPDQGPYLAVQGQKIALLPEILAHPSPAQSAFIFEAWHQGDGDMLDHGAVLSVLTARGLAPIIH